MRTERPEPILPARSLDETRTFYEKLGFAPWFRGRGNEGYEIISRGHLVVHFFAEPGLINTKRERCELLLARQGCGPVLSGVRRTQASFRGDPSADRACGPAL